MYKITLELTQEEADAIYQALDGRHQEYLGEEDQDCEEAAACAAALDKVVVAFRKTSVCGFR